ncbi:MAG: UDP-N-acetylglucosamine--N-acetylmuramyl-(pentapeptide) pyrophosphoryl-undecaprenol [Dehalococcoidia bacterium]|nr:UDP-N-acetylglucosamine--N-acetylmuramyl-(pentapeptide) pyrophosphoryl-undecaprenol [Dehalococcoidia bacterium]
MRIVVTGGGSGGHVYPIFSVLEALVAQSDGATTELDALYIGGKSGVERTLASERGLPFKGVLGAPFRGGDPITFVIRAARTLIGTLQALYGIRNFHPDAILATGGYVSVPAVLAGWILGIPSVIYLPDVEPGWAVKFLSRFAHTVAVTTHQSRPFLRGANVVETGYPVRSEFLHLDRAAARRMLSLELSATVLLVMGGSQGSHSLNVAIGEALPQLLEICDVIHICGSQDEAWLRERTSRLSAGLMERYHLYSYMHNDIAAAMAAADLAVSRAGASVLGELPAVGLPAILVPYPYAGGHQERNAAVLVNDGAAVMVSEYNLETLLPTIREVLQDHSARLSMAQRMRALARPDAAARIAGLLSELARGEVPLVSGAAKS